MLGGGLCRGQSQGWRGGCESGLSEENPCTLRNHRASGPASPLSPSEAEAQDTEDKGCPHAPRPGPLQSPILEPLPGPNSQTVHREQGGGGVLSQYHSSLLPIPHSIADLTVSWMM